MKEFLKKYLILIVTFIYCIIFSFIYLNVAKYHEAWADEAQAWLLARDTNILELIKSMRYEGSPCLWHLILKFAIFCGLSYEKIYYIPFISTITGIIFLYKNKNVPWIFKFTIPFTYFIFFQYTVVSRSYCLIFPLLMMIANIYDKKEEKIITYGILLFLLMNISLHGILIAGGLWAEFGYDVLKKYRNNKKKIERKKIVFLVTIFILILTVIIMIFPKEDCMYAPSPNYNFFELFGEAIYTANNNLIINIIATILVITILLIISNKENYFKNLVIFFPVFLLNLVVTCFPWHVGLLYLIILFLLIINNSFKNKKIYILFLISIIIQIYWTIIASQYDIDYKYSAGKEVSQYIKQIEYKEKNIIALGFHSVSINVYFENNIFDNYSKACYGWSKEDLKKTSVIEALPYIIENNSDVVIVPDYTTDETKQLIEQIEKLGYTKKVFKAYMVVKDYLDQRTGFYVLEKIGE